MQCDDNLELVQALFHFAAYEVVWQQELDGRIPVTQVADERIDEDAERSVSQGIETLALSA